MQERILKSCLTSVADFECCFANTIQDFNFKPGSLVLVLNKKVKATSNAKCKPQYFRPMVVASRSQNGSYRLTEVDGTVSKLKFTAFQLIPYFQILGMLTTWFALLRVMSGKPPSELAMAPMSGR